MCLENMVAITLQTTIQQLGPIPDEHGPMVAHALEGDDTPLKLALGMYLDDCRQHQNYSPLDKLQEEIDNRGK
jgi:hypothetical protein